MSDGVGVSSAAEDAIPFRTAALARWSSEDLNTGEGALSLSGLISSGRGRIGDLGDSTPLGASTFFHLVDETDVLMGDGFGSCLFTLDVETGVFCSKGRRGAGY